MPMLNVCLTGLIGLVGSKFITDTIDHINSEKQYNQRIQSNLLMSFVIAICLIGISTIILRDSFMDNMNVRYGLILCSIILVVQSLCYNWHAIQQDTKMYLGGIVVFALICYSYYANQNKKNKKKDKN